MFYQIAEKYIIIINVINNKSENSIIGFKFYKNKINNSRKFYINILFFNIFEL